jgi:hypothetical protein
MTDWTRQVSEFQRAWLGQQQKFLLNWLGTLQNAGSTKQHNVWEQSVSTVEQQVNHALDMQKQTLMAIVENLEQVEGAPQAYTHWVRHLEEGLDMWADMQHRLWEAWFDMLRSVKPAAQSPGKTPVMGWQEMAERAVSLQQQWLSDLTSASSAVAGGTGKRTGKSPATKKSSTGNGKSSGHKAN